jgi:SAM-dependent methyltransferase
MQNSSDFPDGSFFDVDYFERGRATGKSWYEGFRWMPRRSFREALAVIDFLQLDDRSRILDVGCAKGFLVRALRELEINADGCDISKYALFFAPKGCWYCGELVNWVGKDYTHAFVKDVFEHCRPAQLDHTLQAIAMAAPLMMCIVPLGDGGVYRIPEYKMDSSHLIAENETWWLETFARNGWKVKNSDYHVPGIKDCWFEKRRDGNMVFLLERINVD